MENEFILEPTASMVVEMSQPLYKNNPLLNDFIKAFNLDSGKELVKKCREITPICDQILLNRKFWVYDHLVEQIDKINKPAQIVLLAAGKTPLSLQLLLSHSKKIKHIYEVDLTSLEDKKAVYKNLNTNLNEKISFLQYDLTNDNWLNELIKIGLNTQIPTFFVMEGISYYLSSSCLKNMIKVMQSLSQGFVSIDFKYPKKNNYNTENQKHQTQIFAYIKDYCNLDFITSYDRFDLEELLKDMVTNTHYFSIDAIEKKRTGQNQYFSANDREIIGFNMFSIITKNRR